MNHSEEEQSSKPPLNIIALLKNPSKVCVTSADFHSTFNHLKNKANQFIRQQQFQEALQNYLKCVDMIELGKNMFKDHCHKFMQISIYANMAACFQNTWKIQKCQKYIDKASQQLQKLLQKQNTEEYLKLVKIFILMRFQHCAILSQLNQHQKALDICRLTLEQLKDIVDILMDYVHKMEEERASKKEKEGVVFSEKVYSVALQILLALQKKLTQFIEPRQSKSSTFYFWQRNPQKNEQQLKKMFLPQPNTNSKRSILGVNKQNNWVDEFNIGAVMRMAQLKQETLVKNVPMEQYLFKDKLYQLVIYCALGFFTSATEMRFIDSQRSAESSQIQKENSKLDIIKKRYGYSQKSQGFKLSEAYHLRAIEMITCTIQTPIPFLTHMIKSYEKHYVFKKKLEEIAAIVDESAMEMSSFAMLDRSKSCSKLNSKMREGASRVKEEVGHDYVEVEGLQGQLYDDYMKNRDQGDISPPLQSTHFLPHKTKLRKSGRNTARLSLSNGHQDEFHKRTKSMGKFKKQDKQQKNYTPNPHSTRRAKTKKHKTEDKIHKKEDKGKKNKNKCGALDGQGELHVRTKSSTSIKFVFKKKK